MTPTPRVFSLKNDHQADSSTASRHHHCWCAKLWQVHRRHRCILPSRHFCQHHLRASSPDPGATRPTRFCGNCLTEAHSKRFIKTQPPLRLSALAYPPQRTGAPSQLEYESMAEHRICIFVEETVWIPGSLWKNW